MAGLIKSQITHDFLNLVDVFVSSDSTSISVGRKWLDDVSAALKNAKVELVICSEDSVKRPWIYFEAGAGWVKDIEIVPICHTGMRPVDLPIPLNMLQGIEATDIAGLQRVYLLLAKKLGCTPPPQSFVRFVKSVQVFEHEYGIVRHVRYHVSSLLKLLPDLRPFFQPNPARNIASGMLNTILVDKMKPHLEALQRGGYIKYDIGRRGSIKIGPQGQDITVEIEVQNSYYSLASQVFQCLD